MTNYYMNNKHLKNFFLSMLGFIILVICSFTMTSLIFGLSNSSIAMWTIVFILTSPVIVGVIFYILEESYKDFR